MVELAGLMPLLADLKCRLEIGDIDNSWAKDCLRSGEVDGPLQVTMDAVIKLQSKLNAVKGPRGIGK